MESSKNIESAIKGWKGKDFPLILKCTKKQTIDIHRGPPASYRAIHKPLPEPPRGMEWVFDEDNREWKLERYPDYDVVADAGIQDDENECREPYYFLEHQVQSQETFADLCLQYKLTPSELREANPGIFEPSSSKLAPNQSIRIPYRPDGVPMVEKPVIAEQLYPLPTPQDKIKTLHQMYPKMSKSEAKCYLELNDWDLSKAIQNASEDGFVAAKR